jgi:uncharacterized protein Usg
MKGIIIRKKQLVTIDIFYYRPDFTNIVQEFIFQHEDLIPELYSTHKFLNHWHKNIDAIVQEVVLMVNDTKYGQYRSIDQFLNLN